LKPSAPLHPASSFLIRLAKSRIKAKSLAVGPGKRDDNGKQIALDVKVGDRVLFGKYAGQAVKVAGDEVLVMREEDIMGVVVA
jgi:co-chaperonin GroES (HSP10)